MAGLALLAMLPATQQDPLTPHHSTLSPSAPSGLFSSCNTSLDFGVSYGNLSVASILNLLAPFSHLCTLHVNSNLGPGGWPLCAVEKTPPSPRLVPLLIPGLQL